MSSFKRRVPGAASPAGSHASSSATAASQLPAGVRPSATSSLPQPLLSTGVAALDDLVAGRGIPSGTSLLLIPEAYAASSSYSTDSSSRDPWVVNAAEPYTDLLLAYSLAQGIAHQHHNLVITQHPLSLLESLMARVGDTQQDATPPQPDTSSSEQQEQQDSLKIAFRYANMPILNVDSSNNTPISQNVEDAKKEFPSTFDLSRRISPRTLEKAKADGIVECIDILDTSADPYEHAWKAVQSTAQRLKAATKQSPLQPPPVLRIYIRAVGSPAWQQHSTSPASLTRFLLRIKTLLRSLSVPPFPASSSQHVLIPAIATITLSSHLITALPSLLGITSREADDDIDISHRLASLADTTLALSSFAARPSLRHLLVPSADKKKSGRGKSSLSKHGYTGAIRVLRSASGIGGWNSEVVRASVLRGMSGSASSTASSAGGGGGGSGAGENDLAFRVGRKKLAIELLNVDDVGLARKEEEQQESAVVGASQGQKSSDGGFAQKMEELRIKEDELRAIALGLGGAGAAAADGSARQAAAPPAAAGPSSPSLSSKKKGPTGLPSSSISNPESQPQPQAQPAATMPKFGGLASLRQKGLAARAAANNAAPTGGAGAPRTVSVELEGGSPASSQGRAEAPSSTSSMQHRRPVFETRPDQLEF